MGFILHFKVLLLVMIILILQSCSDVKENSVRGDVFKVKESKLTEQTLKLNSALFEKGQLSELVKVHLGIKNLSNEQILKSDIFNNEELDLSGLKLNDISGIEKFSKLKKLNLSDNRIKNLLPISGLKDLEELNINNNKVKNLSFLSKMKALKVLIASNNEFEEVSALAKLDLQSLDISYNKIYDLSGVYSLSELKHFNISGLPYEIDLGELFVLRSLESLAVNDAKVLNEEGLSLLKNLNSIEFKRMKKVDFSAIQGTKVSSLDLEGNNLLDIGFLLGNLHLKKLSLKNNRLDKNAVTALGSIIGLKVLDLSNNYISGDLNFRSNNYLSKLLLNKNALRGLVSLNFSENTDLKFLAVDENPIISLRLNGLKSSSRRIIEKLIPSVEKGGASNDFIALNE